MSTSIFLRLREERERLGRTQSEFAEIAGVTRRPYAEWESPTGKTSPTAQSLAALAAAGADVLYILTGHRSQGMPEVELLPSDERTLVDAYRRCPTQAKQTLIQTAALLSAGMGEPATAKTGKGVQVGGNVGAGAVVVTGKVRGGIGNETHHTGKAQKVIQTGAGSVQVGVQTGGRNVVKNVRK